MDIVTLDSLYNQAKKILAGLKYVPGGGVLDYYELPDATEYQEWYYTSIRYLERNFGNDSVVKDFRRANTEFEDTYDPSSLSKMIGILSSLRKEPSSSDSSALSRILMEEVDSMYCKYKSLSYSEANLVDSVHLFLDWYSNASSLFSMYFSESDPEYRKFRTSDPSGDGYIKRELFRLLMPSYMIMMNKIKFNCVNLPSEKGKEVPTNNEAPKTPLLFISHSSKDAKYAKALVNLLLKRGFTDKTLFCSSSPGYGLREGEDIYGTLRSKFLEHDIYVVFLLSHNYYTSPACLNEMGAAWYISAQNSSILVPGFKVSDIEGAVGKSKITINLDEPIANSRLNEFNDNLAGFFHLAPMQNTAWESHRDEFLKTIME